MNSSNLFGQNVKALRQSLDISQAVLGSAIGLSKQAINDIEHERSRTTLDKAIALADYFNVSLDYLVGRSNDPKIHN